MQCCFQCNKYLSRLLYRTASPTSATRLPEDSSGAWLESRIPNNTCACQLVRADVRHLQNGLFVPTHPKHPIPSDCIHCTYSKYSRVPLVFDASPGLANRHSTGHSVAYTESTTGSQCQSSLVNHPMLPVHINYYCHRIQAFASFDKLPTPVILHPYAPTCTSRLSFCTCYVILPCYTLTAHYIIVDRLFICSLFTHL